jgi:glutaredoxin 3
MENKNIILALGGIGLIWFAVRQKKGSFSKHNIVLYDLQHCPYCQKVRDKLDELGLDYTQKDIEEPKFKKELAKKRKGKTTVPYIEIDGEGIEESDIIVEILEDRFGC